MSINPGFHDIGQHCECYLKISQVSSEKHILLLKLLATTELSRCLLKALMENSDSICHHAEDECDDCKLIRRAEKELQ